MNSLCYDPYHLKIIRYEHIAALSTALEVQKATALNFHCLATLNCIAHTSWITVNDVKLRCPDDKRFD